MVIIVRLGLVALVAANFVGFLAGKFASPSDLPFSDELASWHGGPHLLLIAVVGALALWGFWASVSGRPGVRESITQSA